jgi:hypothetical protein
MINKFLLLVLYLTVSFSVGVVPMSFDVTSNDPTFNFSIQRENSERLFEWEFGSILLNKYGKKLLQLDKTLDEFKQMGVVFNEKLPTKFNKTGKSIVVKGSINFKRFKRPQDQLKSLDCLLHFYELL